jgi:AcrR family transcriptional regulator
MPKNLEIDFSDAKQDRAKKTLDDLLQAAYAIVEEADPAAFTSRSLAGKAGYSLGTLSKRLGSVENVFFWAIQKGRELKFAELARAIDQLDPKFNVSEFVELFVDKSFSGINAVAPSVMRFYDQRFTKKNGLSTDYFDYVDVLVEPYQRMCLKNESNTFRIVSQDEARLIFKAILTFVERPFANGDPIMGTAEHRRIAVEAITRMLAK